MPSNRRPDASTLTIQGRLADFHECFHHANIEYYQGEAESHGVFREKRLPSLVSNGRAVPDDGFARTDEILAAAKAKNAPANASVLTMAKVDKAAYNSTRTVESFLGASSTAVSTNGSSHGRELNRGCSAFHLEAWRNQIGDPDIAHRLHQHPPRTVPE